LVLPFYLDESGSGLFSEVGSGPNRSGSATLHRTLLKSTLEPLAAFQNGCVKIPEPFQLLERKGSIFKREGAFTPSFQKSFEKLKIICKFNIILKGEKFTSNDYLAEHLTNTYPTIPVLAHYVKSLSL
jgi:hypothetical protein